MISADCTADDVTTLYCLTVAALSSTAPRIREDPHREYVIITSSMLRYHGVILDVLRMRDDVTEATWSLALRQPFL